MYFDAMTDPEYKPSFLARLATLATIGVVIIQIMMAIEVRPHAASVVLIFIPAFSFMAVAGIYYLFKGKPSGADSVIASGLYRAWSVSVIGGAAYSLFV